MAYSIRPPQISTNPNPRKIMNPLITKISNLSGVIDIAIHRFKTVYTFRGEAYNSYRTLSAAIRLVDADFTPGDDSELKTNILKLERETLLRHYASAVKPKTIDNLLIDLSDRGLETNMIIVPCLGEDCKMTKIEEIEAPLRLDEMATKAEYASDFTDGLCEECHTQGQQEDALEEEARNRHEAREDQYNV